MIDANGFGVGAVGLLGFVAFGSREAGSRFGDGCIDALKLGIVEDSFVIDLAQTVFRALVVTGMRGIGDSLSIRNNWPSGRSVDRAGP